VPYVEHCETIMSIGMSIGTTARRALITAICLVAAACGGGSGDATPATTAPEASDRSTPAPTQAPATPSVDPPTTDEPAATAPTVTEAPAPTTTQAPAPEPVSFDLTTLPELIVLADRATTDPAISPLSIAQQLIGFPYEIPVADGSTLLRFNARLTSTSEDRSTFEFGYEAIAPGGVVPDVDITLDDNGPGSVEIIETFDPIMAELGFERKNSTASDPGDPGGPNSVNHVYRIDDPGGVFNGVPGEVSPVFIWSREDITGGSYSTDREVLAGYGIDLDVDVTPDAAVPIPILHTLLPNVPVPDGLVLSGARVDFRSRTPDSFFADKGLNYIAISLEWEGPAELLEAVIAFYENPSTVFSDVALLMAGEDDFFAEGTIAPTELTDYDVASKRLELLLLQRYEATLGIDASDDEVEPMTVFFDLEINLVAPQLALPTG